MPLEIERKFLVLNDTWRLGAVGEAYCQGYLSQYPNPTVRVRTEGPLAFLTIKGKTEGITRPEFEYSIPYEEALDLQELCVTPLVKKIRYKIPYEGLLWEVDEFQEENAGLILAEVELEHPETPIIFPPWVGDEISTNKRYANSNLALFPFTKW